MREILTRGAGSSDTGAHEFAQFDTRRPGRPFVHYKMRCAKSNVWNIDKRYSWMNGQVMVKTQVVEGIGFFVLVFVFVLISVF